MHNANLQTILPAFRRIRFNRTLERETLQTPDNDFLDLDWAPGSRDELVILVHGLAGSSQSRYIRGLQKALMNSGLRTVALNFRGCSGRPNNSANAYHSGETGDLNYVYNSLRQREPETAIAVVGFSLGGNVVLKWLGEYSSNLDLFAAVAVSVPFELAKCADQMDRGFSRFYRNLLLDDLVEYMQDKYRHLQSLAMHQEAEKIAALGNLTGIRSFWEYDNRVVAPLYGFKDAHHYYADASSRRFMKSIRAPTLVLQALDDPFMTPEVVPDRSEISPQVQLETSRKGGHVGFVSGTIPGRPVYWLEQRIPRFLRRQLSLYRRGTVSNEFTTQIYHRE